MFSDDFDGAQLDRTAWNRYNSVGGIGSGWRRPEPITVGDGKLRITARGNVSGGMNTSTARGTGVGSPAHARQGPRPGSASLLWPDSLDKEADGELDVTEVPREDRSKAHSVILYSTPEQARRQQGGRRLQPVAHHHDGLGVDPRAGRDHTRRASLEVDWVGVYARR